MPKNKNKKFTEKYNLWISIGVALLGLAFIANQTISTLAYLDLNTAENLTVNFKKHSRLQNFQKPLAQPRRQ